MDQATRHTGRLLNASSICPKVGRILAGYGRSLRELVVTLGKNLNTLGKAFAECNTRHRALSKNPIGKPSLPSVFFRALGKEGFALRHSTKKQISVVAGRWKPNLLVTCILQQAMTNPCPMVVNVIHFNSDRVIALE
jgi:hypothetical protein